MKRKKKPSELTMIDNCEDRFQFRCPRRWSELTPTGDDKVRHCEVCQKNVYYCENVAELEERAREGRCAAIDSGPGLLIGELNPLY